MSPASKLKPLLEPRSIAFVGASNDPNKWGCIVLGNVLRGKFAGKIYPVNPHQKEILGLPAYATIADIPETPDLAAIVVPPNAIVEVIKDCLAKGIKAGLIITAGLGEVGEEGKRLQDEAVRLARQGGMVLQGPNCNGVMNPRHKFYCTMPAIQPQPGPLAIVAQSGNVAGSVAGDIMAKGLGISYFISSGNEADLHQEDFLEYLGEDESTKVIMSYVEGFRNGRRFLEVAKKVTRKKPIVMLKAGDTPAGAMAAKSHTASLAGSDTISNAAFKQAGIIRVISLEEMLDIGSIFIRQPLPKGNRVGIITRGGGWGVLASDACNRYGLELAKLSEQTLTELDKHLPPWWPRSNPVDMVAGLSKGDVTGKLLEILLSRTEVDGVLALSLSATKPGAISAFDPLSGKGKDAARYEFEGFSVFLKEALKLVEQHKKPVVAVTSFTLASGESAAQMATLTRETQTLAYPSPLRSAAAFGALYQYARYLRETAEE